MLEAGPELVAEVEKDAMMGTRKGDESLAFEVVRVLEEGGRGDGLKRRFHCRKIYE